MHPRSRQHLPAAALQWALPRNKTCPPHPFRSSSTKNFAQHAINRQFWAIFRAQGELFRAHAHHQTKQGELFRAQDPARGDFATNDTSAATDAGQHETTITTARP